MVINSLDLEYVAHVKKAVGGVPSNKEIGDVDREIEKISVKSGKVKELYNEKLSKLWKTIIAYENKPDELNLLVKSVKIHSGDKVTSIASGLCVFEAFIAKRFLINGQINAIDFSKEMNKQAKDILKKLNVKNIKVICASAIKLPIKDDSQNLVLARRTGLSSTNEWPLVLKEVYRIIKRDGIFVYTVDKNFFDSLEKAKKQLSSAGLSCFKHCSFIEKDRSKIIMIFARRKNDN